MAEEKNYYELLLEESPEEKAIWEEVEAEVASFEKTPEYLEHNKRLKALYKKQSEAQHKRWEEAKKVKIERHRRHTEEKTLTKEEIQAIREKHRKEREDEINALPEPLSTMVKSFSGLSAIEKEKFFQMVRHEWHSQSELPKMENPKTTIENIKELQEVLVQTCIDYINDYKLDIDAVSFGADSLQTSAKYGQWTPSTDSSITVEGYGFEKGKDGKEFGVRKLIGEYF